MATETTTDQVALIKAHALNELRVVPLSVTANDRIFLVREIEKMQAIIETLAAEIVRLKGSMQNV